MARVLAQRYEGHHPELNPHPAQDAFKTHGSAVAPRVLLVEDDPDTVSYVRDGLSCAQIDLSVSENGIDGLTRIFAEKWDVIVLDRMLPGYDGLSILEKMRSEGITTPVIFLTAMDSVFNRVDGLRHGGDDYVVKPFAVRELLARIQVLFQRFSPVCQVTHLYLADVTFNLLTRDVTRGDEKILLQPQEMRLLEYFMRHPDTVLSRQMLLKHVWDMDFPVRTNVVETHLSRLREKLGRNGPALIHTVRGQGYVMSADTGAFQPNV